MLDRKLRRRVERAFYEYKTNSDLSEDAIIELAESGLTAKYGAVGGGSGAGNPTESKVIKAVDSNDTFLWCTVVDKTLRHFQNTGKDTLIRLRYFERLKPWKCCEKLYISDSYRKLWINDILEYAVTVAACLQLIKIEDI